jgi:hypothetical protein
MGEAYALTKLHLEEKMDREVLDCWLHNIDYKTVPEYREYIDKINDVPPPKDLTPEQEEDLLLEFKRASELLMKK